MVSLDNLDRMDNLEFQAQLDYKDSLDQQVHKELLVKQVLKVTQDLQDLLVKEENLEQLEPEDFLGQLVHLEKEGSQGIKD